MVDIYDELGHIKNILANGIDDMKWQRDASLLAKFYAETGVKKSEAKKIIREKCEKYSKNYNHIQYFKKLNKIVDTSYKEIKDGKQIRHITEVVISQEVLDWFLGLENNFTISDEKKNEIEKNRKAKIGNKPLIFNRVKMLFTLYIWTLIQADYVNVPNVHYLKKYMAKFKKDADLPKTFSINKEKNILYDLGLLYVNGSQGIDVIFVRDNHDVFGKEITKDNKIVIAGEDLYNCGLWLEKKKYGSYICQNCGKEFSFKGKGRGEKSRKYCDDCLKQLYPIKNETTRICVDCGIEFKVTKMDTKSIRCSNCQEEHRREIKRDYMRRVREEKTN